MLTLVSPAKKLLCFNKPYLKETTIPIFPDKTAELLTLMKTLSPSALASLMHLSDELAQLNYQRYQHVNDADSALSQRYPAIFLFRGDVYKTLNADQWDSKTLQFAQSNLCILSGLYGLLRPLDLIQPHRLEMGTALQNSCGRNLYDFWKKAITQELNSILSTHKNPMLINLASNEYFNVVDKKLLQAPCLTVHFKELKDSKLKVIGIHAKKARGAMANYLIQHQVDDVNQIKSFNVLNYRFCENSSDLENYIFIRGSG